MATTSALGTGVQVPADYSSRDFLSIQADLTNSLSTYMPEWTSTSVANFGMALLDLFAYTADIESYYLDRIANEAFLATAQQRSSVLNLAYLIDYSPADASPASANLSLTIAANSPAFILPAATQFATPATNNSPAIIFELAVQQTIPANTTSSPVVVTSTVENSVTTLLTVVQGVTVSNESVGASTGNAGQSFSLFNTGVLTNTVAVFVDEGNGPKAWAAVGNLADYGPYDAVYAIAEDANGIVYVLFGDGINGRVPNPSGLITANYRVGGGVVGNVGAGQITVSLANIGYISAVTNATAAVGGADPETIPQIQVNAPKSLTAADRCVSAQDYASVALNVPGVSKASAVASAAPASVNLYIHPAGGPFTQANLTAQVTGLAPSLTWGGAGAVSSTGASGYLDTRKQIGATVTVLPPQVGGTTVGYVQIVLAIAVQVLPNYSTLQVQQDVEAAINTLFDFGSMNFGQRLTLSSVYHAVQVVPGVDYATVSSMYRADQASALGDIICAASELPVVTDPDTGSYQITITPTGGI